MTRTWGGYGALGTGLVLVALGAEHLRHHPALSVLLLPLGAATLLVAVLSLRGAGRHLRPGGVLTAVAGAAAVLAGLGTGRTGTAELVALVLGVLSGALLAASAGPRAAGVVARRDGRGEQDTPGDDGGNAWSRLALLALGALLASAATVQGLAATEAGEHAVPHGLHGIGGHHG
ncbi:hypothetical protein GC089_04550 [Cellulomonas sp. JZ18]|uniref:hypothetical protein n=1 Tax=Cellulomonas sp. JZ18 TaxID=2654191 RepID=UPI0012D420E8|nr:hypothetical protein [Cellulomonas sp. JZ18]QGQ18646.1 hypothetical protein GC089_04550 [Cellulomonas sp. JZ18]